MDQHTQLAGIEPGTSRNSNRLQLTPRMLLHGCEAATVTPSSDKKMLIQAETALAGSGSAR